MFDIDKWQEIFYTIKQNKLRTALTGFSIAWGIFIFVILMAAGKGLENGVRSHFSDDLVNSFWLGGGQTAMPYKGYKAGRQIPFTYADCDVIKNNVAQVSNIGANMWFGDNVVSYKNNYAKYEVCASTASHLKIEGVGIVEGRNINNADITNSTKVAIISIKAKNTLFTKNSNVIGSYINIKGVLFKVVGIYIGKNEWGANRIYIPLTTGQSIYSADKRIHAITLTVNTSNIEQSIIIENQIRKKMAGVHGFDPNDKSAMWINNVLLELKQVTNLFLGIKIFVAIIGIMTILAGIMGVSNIMIIVVNERKKEIGIRKTVGAKPMSVVYLILQESVFITAFSGYVGLVLGVTLVEFVAKYIPTNEFFLNPEINFSMAIFATALLVIAGALAGLFPALKAARIKPIEVLKDE